MGALWEGCLGLLVYGKMRSGTGRNPASFGAGGQSSVSSSGDEQEIFFIAPGFSYSQGARHCRGDAEPGAVYPDAGGVQCAAKRIAERLSSDLGAVRDIRDQAQFDPRSGRLESARHSDLSESGGWPVDLSSRMRIMATRYCIPMTCERLDPRAAGIPGRNKPDATKVSAKRRSLSL